MKKKLTIAIIFVLALAISGGAQAKSKDEIYPNTVKTTLTS
jgi:hypothetical protein